MLDEEVRRSTGVLVKKVNVQAVPALADEMRSPSRTRRLRALAMAAAMRAVAELESPIVALLSDEDHLVRGEAAQALGECNTPMAREALGEALLDRSIVVREAAERSLQNLARLASAGRAPTTQTATEPRP
jgi:HEAT repeat protein